MSLARAREVIAQELPFALEVSMPNYRQNIAIGLVDDVLRRYDEPHRKYHGVVHIGAMLLAFREERIARRWDFPDRPQFKFTREEAARVVLRIVYHDVIYVPGARTNERLSAKYFDQVAQQCNMASRVRGVREGIVMTQRHDLRAGASIEDHLFLDLDLASFALPQGEYDEQSASLREEYVTHGDVEAKSFALGRKCFLEEFLMRHPKQIFVTKTFERLNVPAYANIERELDQLKKTA